MIRDRAVILVFVSALLALALPPEANTQPLDYKPEILLVTAHPDDDALFAATVFKTTHLLEGAVDLAIFTNGEGGYRYSTLANYIYDRELDKEEVGRAYLPGIRKREVMAGGKIMGLRNYFFFDQVDKQYSEDIENPLRNWDTGWVQERLLKILSQHKYDFVFTMMPSRGTHAHHKASAVLTLQAIQQLPEDERPIVLATDIVGSTEDSTDFRQLEGYPLTKRMEGEPPMLFDRTQTFGHQNRLNYKIISNWVIAEHKSQGTMQLYMGQGNVEQYWPYALNNREQLSKARDFFRAVNEVPIYRNPNVEFGKN